MARENHFIVLFLSIVIALLTSSCEYDPHKVFYRNVNEDAPPPEVQAVELFVETDTIYLYSDKKIRFKFLSSDQEIKAVRFAIDDFDKYIVNSNTGSFTLVYDELPYGIHVLKLEVYTAKGSGSIAEHLGLEGYVFTKTWVLNVVDYGGYYNKNITKTVTDGLLHLTWEPYRGSDFSEYILYKSGYTNKTIRLVSNHYIDSTYVGEPVVYEVKVITESGLLLKWANLILGDDLPMIYFSVSDNNLYTVKWDRSKYFNAVDTFKLCIMNNLYINISSPPTYKTYYTTCNPEDTVYNIPPEFFGDIIRVKIRVVPKKANYHNPANSYMIESYTGDIRPGYQFSFVNGQAIQNINQVSDNEFICILGFNNLISYSVSEKHITGHYYFTNCLDNEIYSLSASASGKYLTIYGNCNKDVMLTNSDNFRNNNFRDLKSLIGDYYLPYIPVSDSGIVLVDSINRGFFVYDHFSGSVLSYYQNENIKTYGLAISANCRYIILRDDSLRLARYSNSQLSIIRSFSKDSPPSFFEFNGYNPDWLVIFEGNHFTVKRCNDFSDVYGFILPETKILDIDYFNTRMLTWSTGHLFVRSLIDGALLKDIPVNINASLPERACYLVDNAIVSIQGVLYYFE